MVATALKGRHPGGGLLLDIGCGTGNLWSFVTDQFDRYAGADTVHYEGFPKEGEFHLVELDTGRVPLPDNCADVVAAVETIEHLENPRAFVRELVRLAKPGGWVVVTTPNQLSLLSKLGLLVRNQFPHFRGSAYPAHITALLEIDLRRIATECGLSDLAVTYTGRGRMPGVRWQWPGFLSRLFRRSLSDNILIASRKPSR
ncbi:MAG TPA: methyltransferase domain-containing protein [Gemmata sp.]|nr:methyltransferase domain-containing protein [Gemmata sp.]